MKNQTQQDLIKTRNITAEFLLSYIFGRAPKLNTEYIIIETFSGKRELRDVLTDILCAAYIKEKRKLSAAGKPEKP